MKTTKRMEKLAGLFFLLPLLTFGTGSVMVDGLLQAEHPAAAIRTANDTLITGGLLMLLNSFCVVALGALVYPVISRSGKTTAIIYLSGRILEALLLLVGLIAVWLLIPFTANAQTDSNGMVQMAVQVKYYSYQLAMLSLGAGSIGCCWLLLRKRLLPRWLALTALIGYVLLMLGSVLELYGFRVGILLSIPGGLAELGIAIVVMTRGFGQQH